MKIKRVLLPVGAFALLGMTAALMAKSINSTKEIKQVKADTADVIISSDAEFASFISAVNGGTRYDNELVQLAADVSYEITVKPTAADPWSIFAGTFDGANHTIAITVNMTDTCPSLFRNLGNADFQDAVFKNTNINYSVVQSVTGGNIYAAPVATYNNGLIQNVHTTMNFNVSSVYYVGGIVEKNQSVGIIENCSVDGTIAATSYVGGIVAENLGTIRNCTVNGNIEGNNHLGGIAATNNSLIENCKNYSTIQMTSGSFAGGITSVNGTTEFVNARIIKSINYANINSAGAEIGGIAGFMYSNAKISYCDNYGNISSSSTSEGRLGGFVGRIANKDENSSHTTKIEYCYNAGNISGLQSCGGLIGIVNSNLVPVLQITGCLSTGSVNGTKQNSGTFIGWTNSNTISVTDSWAVGAKLGVTALGVAGGTAAGATYSKADGVSDDFRAIIKAIREYNCVAIPGFGALYGGLDDGEKTLLNQINYYDDLNTYAMKTYGQAAEYIIDDQAHGARISLLSLNNNYWAVIIVISVMVLSITSMVFVIRRKKNVTNK